MMRISKMIIMMSSKTHLSNQDKRAEHLKIKRKTKKIPMKKIKELRGTKMRKWRNMIPRN